MKTQVKDELCIGCGLCAETCPQVFIMNDEKAKANTEVVPPESEECCKKATADCPVEAIITEG